MKRSGRSSSDIISNLPNNVTESILTCLPIRDAVRTSVLSTKWKDKWVKLPHLVFDETHAPMMIDEVEVIKVISQVLLQHNSPVLKFVLSIRHLKSCPSINDWLGFLSRNGIEELTLEIQSAQSHEIPFSFFSCQHLKCLKLSNCIVRPPPSFTGFRKLTSIDFRRVLCSATSLGNLIASSPLLKKLTLFHILYLHSLTIYAPNLECLWLRGDTQSLCSINVPRLSLLSLSISRYPGLSNLGERNTSSNLVNLLCCLPETIEQLQLNGYTSQISEVGNMPKNIPNTFSVLWEIILGNFSFEDLDSVACLCYLIRNSPNVEVIQMFIKSSRSPLAHIEPVITLMKANLDLSVNLKKLLSFTITSFGGTKPEVEFIKFMLASSPLIRKVTIKADRAHPSYNGFTTLQELIFFSRASSAAQIIYSD